MPTLDLNTTQATEFTDSDAYIDDAYASGVTTNSGGTQLLPPQDGWSKLDSAQVQIAKDSLKRFFSVLFKLGLGTVIQFADDETMTPTGTSWTLVNAPNPSTSLKIYRNGVREYNFTLSSNIVTLSVARGTDHITADYRY